MMIFRDPVHCRSLYLTMSSVNDIVDTRIPRVLMFHMSL